MSPDRRAGRAVAALVLVLVVAACSGDDDAADPTSTSPSSTTAPVAARPAVDLAGLRLRPVPEGAGVPQGSEGDALAGYTEVELLLAGTARTYEGPATGPVEESGDEIPYVTRLLVRAPADPEAFSGRVVVEPFNTSGGADLGVVWAQASELLRAEGDAWIGVTERASSVAPLQTHDAARYADLDVPTNDVAWDILRHVGALLKGPADTSPLGDLPVEGVYMAGFSQSGIDTATFALAFNERTRMDDGDAVYDGYLPAGHSGSLTPVQPGEGALPKFEHAEMTAVDVPVIDLETQTDVEGFEASISPTLTYTSVGSAGLRRADSDRPDDLYRLWEVAGAPHAGSIPSCDGGGSSFPTAAFVRAALVRIFEWAEEGEEPPEAPRIDVASIGEISASEVDDHGNATGGVRSPFVDVPLARYEVHATPGALCQLAGRETALPEDVVDELYPDAATYEARFAESLDETISAGFLLPSDRAGIVIEARTRAAAAFFTPGG